MSRYVGKLKSVIYLHEKLKDAGIVGYSSTDNFREKWLYRLERQGRLVCPISSTNHRDRLFTEEQIEEIIQAFTPGGVGEWSYLDEKKV